MTKQNIEIQPIHKMKKWLIGSRRLPAGVIPLATEKGMQIICIAVDGRWVRWCPAEGSMQSMPSETQREVINVLVNHMGGTAGKMAELLTVSSRTVEVWRTGKIKLPPAKAYEIAEVLSRKG